MTPPGKWKQSSQAHNRRHDGFEPRSGDAEEDAGNQTPIIPEDKQYDEGTQLKGWVSQGKPPSLSSQVLPELGVPSPALREAKLRPMNEEEDARGTLVSMPIGRGHTASYKKERLKPIAEKNRLIEGNLDPPSPGFTPSIGEDQAAGMVLASVSDRASQYPAGLKSNPP